MPVEIRELVIRAVVTSGSEAQEPQAETEQPAVDRDALVQECVQQVLRILQKSKER